MCHITLYLPLPSDRSATVDVQPAVTLPLACLHDTDPQRFYWTISTAPERDYSTVRAQSSLHPVGAVGLLSDCNCKVPTVRWPSHPAYSRVDALWRAPQCATNEWIVFHSAQTSTHNITAIQWSSYLCLVGRVVEVYPRSDWASLSCQLGIRHEILRDA